ncbi:HEAT repeat domain-containing protein [bacterium]
MKIHRIAKTTCLLIGSILLILLFLLSGCASQPQLTSEDTAISLSVTREFQQLLSDLENYDYGQNANIPIALMEIIPQCQKDPECKALLESSLNRFLTENHTLASKQVICEILGQIGTFGSVSTLSEMCLDSSTTDMALYAMERIPGSIVDETLRNLLLKSKYKIAIINTIGHRKDSLAVDILEKMIQSTDLPIAESAIAALGKIASQTSIQKLMIFQSVHKRLQKARSYALLQAANQQLEMRNTEIATSIFKTLWLNEQNQVIKINAFQGLLITDKENAMIYMIDAFTHNNPAFQTAALHSLRSTQPTEVNDLIQMWNKLATPQQIQLLSALTDKGDTTVLSLAKKAIDHDSLSVRLQASIAFGKLGRGEDAIRLANYAAESKGRERDAYRIALYQINQPEINTAILRAISDSNPKTQVELIRSVGQRSIKESTDILLETAKSSNRSVRLETYKALSIVTEPDKIQEMILLLQNATSEAELNEAQNMVSIISLKFTDPDQRPKAVLSAIENETRAEIRAALLQALGKIGHPKTLSILEKALSDESQIRLGVLRALANWPDDAPLTLLERIITHTKINKESILAQRAFITLLDFFKGSDSDKLAEYKKAMNWANDAQTQRMIFSGLGKLYHIESLQFVIPYLESEELRSEAEVAFIQIAWEILETEYQLIEPVVEKLKDSGSTPRTRNQAGWIFGSIQDIKNQ